MKLDTSTLRRLIREALQDMTGDFGPDDPTEHAPDKEPLLDKLFELLANHFKPDFNQSGIIEDAIQNLYDDIQDQMGARK